MRYDVYYHDTLMFEVEYNTSSLSTFYYLDNILANATPVGELAYWSIRPHIDKEDSK
jgi:hypothetical protein